MDDNFEDSFDDEDELDPSDDSLRNKLNQIMSSLINNTSSDMNPADEYESAMQQIESLGEPDSIEEFIEDGFLITKKTWRKEDGQVITVTLMSDILGEAGEDFLTDDLSDMDSLASQFEAHIKESDDETLEKLLAGAVEAEDYQSAILIRDEISSRKK